MNGRRVKIGLSLLAVCALMLVPLVSTPVLGAGSYPFDSGSTEVANALNYLRGEQDAEGSIGGFETSAWVIMAIAAAGEDPHDWQSGGTSIVDYLAANANSATSSTDYSRTLLAIIAAGEDPTDFGGRDFVSLVESTYDPASQQIGDATLLNDDIFGAMALIAAGRSPTSEIVSNSIGFIMANQSLDGGWGVGVGSGSDVDMTAAGTMALIAAGESPSSTAITNALAYIESKQMDNGGFEGFGGAPNNSATDSWAICGIASAGQDPNGASWTSDTGNTPVDDLISFQNPDGSFNWQLETLSNPILMTAYAIPALLGVPYPVATVPGVTVDVRIEGENDTIWSGTVIVSDSTIIDDVGGEHYLADPTALGALDKAFQKGGFPYVVQDTAYGLYLYSVNDEEPVGMGGWMYRVDYIMPWVGVAEFVLGETTPPDPPHQEVVFYYGESYELDGEWGPFPLKVDVDKTKVDVSEAFTVTVTRGDTGAPCEGATVHADRDYLTAADGTVDITIDMDMTLNIYAEKEGYIRSNRVTVTVGTGTGAIKEVGLVAEIVPAISFTVDPSSIDFGVLGPRDTSDPHRITLTNTGVWDLLITCTVTDEADGLYVEGLELDNEMWDLYETAVVRDDYAMCQATLTVPDNYTGIGEQTGTLIFWAAEAP